jgi:sortase A
MNKLGKRLIKTGILLIIISLALITHNNYEEINAGKKSKLALEEIKNNIIEEDNNINKTIVDNSTNKTETTNINGHDYIGTITIPTLNLELPIMSEYDYDKLKISPCRYYGNIHTNDLIICAHSYKTHFKYLNKLKQKDLVIITDINGNNYIYEVVTIEVLKPNQVSEMINNDYDLTLYTCTNDGQNRITVRCNKVLDLA